MSGGGQAEIPTPSRVARYTSPPAHIAHLDVIKLPQPAGGRAIIARVCIRNPAATDRLSALATFITRTLQAPHRDRVFPRQLVGCFGHLRVNDRMDRYSPTCLRSRGPPASPSGRVVPNMGSVRLTVDVLGWFYLILPSYAIAYAFRAGFHLIAQGALPRPVGSRALVTR